MREKIKKITYNLLKRSEKWTKTDMIYLAEGGFWLTLNQGVSSISAFLLAIAFANLLPQEVYGNYKYILSLVGILAIPTLSGMNTAIIQAVSRGYEGSVIPALKTKVKWGLIGGIASLVLALYYYIEGNNTLSISFLISSIFIPFMDSLSVYKSYLNGKKNFKSLSKYDITNTIISTITVLIVILFTKNIFLIIVSYFTSHTIIRLILLKITLEKNKRNNKENIETISYGKHLSLMGVLNTASSYFDKLLIFHYIGAIELAIYIIAIAPPNQLSGLVKNINILALPKLSLIKTENIKKILISKILKISLILSLVSFLYIIIAPFLYKILFPQYLESIFYSQLFSISLILIGPITLLLSFFQAKQKKIILYQYNIIKPIVKIISLLILINFFGVLGVIIAIIITNVFELLFLSSKKMFSSF
jgi:O-antigen/teichoic acid export membrane protein